MKLFRQRHRHWSNSRLANILRGSKKISSGTSEEWRNWEKTAKQKNPLRYWLAEVLLDILQDFVYFPKDVAHSTSVYVSNRFITKSHVLQASEEHLVRGGWYEVGDRILPCIFDEFVGFIDNELRLTTLIETALDDDADELTHARREMLLLYWWWTAYRPARLDPSEKCIQFSAEMRDKYAIEVGDFFGGWKEISDEDRVQQRLLWEEERRIEDEYYKEDSAMLIRLIQIRSFLWS